LPDCSRTTIAGSASFLDDNPGGALISFTAIGYSTLVAPGRRQLPAPIAHDIDGYCSRLDTKRPFDRVLVSIDRVSLFKSR